MRNHPLNPLAQIAPALTGVAVVVLAGVAWGQTAERPAHAGLEPVDQAVADLDPLARSERVVQPGLRADGEQTSLFVMPPRQGRPANAPPRYLRFAPGMRAEMPRGDYLVPVDPLIGPTGQPVATNVAPAADGRFIEIIPADTVFHLEPIDTRITPPSGDPAQPQAGAHPAQPDTRLDYRVNLRVDQRTGTGPISTRLDAQRVEAAPAQR